MTAPTLPDGKPCLGCGEKKPTYRVGRGQSDRACGDCIRSGRVPAMPADVDMTTRASKSRRSSRR